MSVNGSRTEFEERTGEVWARAAAASSFLGSGSFYRSSFTLFPPESKHIARCAIKLQFVEAALLWTAD